MFQIVLDIYQLFWYNALEMHNMTMQSDSRSIVREMRRGMTDSEGWTFPLHQLRSDNHLFELNAAAENVQFDEKVQLIRAIYR